MLDYALWRTFDVKQRTSTSYKIEYLEVWLWHCNRADGHEHETNAILLFLKYETPPRKK